MLVLYWMKINLPPKYLCIYTLRLFLLLQSFGVVSVAEMSGAVSQGRRKEVLTNFKKGKTQVLFVCIFLYN